MSEPRTQSPGSASLEYAPGGPQRRRRRRRRAAAVVLLLMGTALGFWRGPALWKAGQTAYVTRQACNYAAPRDRVIYEDGPTSVRPLLIGGAPAGDTPATVPAATAPAARAAPDPAVLARLAAVSAEPRVFGLFPPSRGPAPQPLAFLHERRTPGGGRVLVALRVSGVTYYPSGGGTLACQYSTLLLRPDGWRPPAHVALMRSWGGVHVPSRDEADPADHGVFAGDPAAPAQPGPIRIYAGFPDPNDPSAFTVPYEVNGRRKQWQFRVTADGIDLEEQETDQRR